MCVATRVISSGGEYDWSFGVIFVPVHSNYINNWCVNLRRILIPKSQHRHGFIKTETIAQRSNQKMGYGKLQKPLWSLTFHLIVIFRSRNFLEPDL